MKRPTIRHLLVCAPLLALLAGCDDDPAPATTPDAGDTGAGGDVQADLNPTEDVADEVDLPDTSGPPLREVVEQSLLDGTPVANRVFNPVLEPLFYGADWFAYTFDGQLVLARRYVSHDAPTHLPAMVYPGDQDVTALGQVYLGTAPAEASIWLGLPAGGGEGFADLNVYLMGYDLERGTTLATVDLVRDRSSRHEGSDVVWYSWTGDSGGLVGSAYLVVENLGDEALYLHAPVVTTATEKRARWSASRPATARERDLVARGQALREERSQAWQRDRHDGRVRRLEPQFGRPALNQ